MRRLIAILLSFILLFSLTGCGQSPSAWQEQYDLGVRYLNEGNYEEAVIAFSAAIGIDPKQPEAYIGMANAYMELGDYDKAAEAVAKGKVACGDEVEFDEILNKIAGLQEEAANSEQEDKDAVNQNGADDSASPLNAYGAIRFELRENYIDFSETTHEQHQLIEMAGTAAISNDIEAIYGILDTVSISSTETESIYTIWNGYKMQLRLGPYIIGDSNQYDSRQIFIIMRPENGTGFYYRIQHTLNLSSGVKSYMEERIACSCVDWQWNGALERVRRSGTETEEFIDTESGQMLDGLRDGEFAATVHYIGGTMDEAHTSTTLYQNGKTLTVNGEEPVMVPEITSINIEGAFSLEDIYW